VALKASPEELTSEGESGEAQEGEQRRSGHPDEPIDAGGKSVEGVVPRLAQTRWSHDPAVVRGGRARFAQLHRQRRVVRLAAEDVQLALELLDLRLQGVELCLHGEDVADRRGLGHDRQVLLAAGLERRDLRLEIDVLRRDVGRLGGELGHLAERLDLFESEREVGHGDLQRDRAARPLIAAGPGTGLGVGDESAVGGGQVRQPGDRGGEGAPRHLDVEGPGLLNPGRLPHRRRQR
jgi:hypothetical protein